MNSIASLCLKYRALLALCLLFGAAPAAHAVVITLNGINYDVSLVYTHDLDPILQETPWAGYPWDMSLADSAAEQVGLQFGLPNIWGYYGPFFQTAYGYNSGYTTFSNGVEHFGARGGESVYFAVATPVSSAVPDSSLTLALLGVSLTGLALFRRRVS